MNLLERLQYCLQKIYEERIRYIGHVEIIFDPSNNLFTQFLKETKYGLRMGIDNSNSIVVWDADKLIHQEVLNKNGYKSFLKTGLIIRKDRTYYMEGDIYSLLDMSNTVPLVLLYKLIKKAKSQYFLTPAILNSWEAPTLDMIKDKIVEIDRRI